LSWWAAAHNRLDLIDASCFRFLRSRWQTGGPAVPDQARTPTPPTNRRAAHHQTRPRRRSPLPHTRHQTRQPPHPPAHHRDAPPNRTRRHRHHRALARPREHQDHLHLPTMRREAPCCIPGAAGRDSEEGPWVQWLTVIRKVSGTTACQESDGHAQVSGVRRRGTRVIWRKLDCLNPNLQKTQRSVRRKDTCYRRHALRRHRVGAVATSGGWSVAQ
jgi:hypothetical protein